ncbi:hypothetical protein diail_1372 [Diaporthe ilicicola]|nr:hypothetical protein diail_1372 [Diaporthe ilicicola]
MVLAYRDDPPRTLESLPDSIVRLELLAYDHFSVMHWQLEVMSLLLRKETITPKLRQLKIERWMNDTDEPASKFELHAGSVVKLGRKVGVDVQVDFLECKEPELGANGVPTGA